jgi:hypothetical protein
MAAIGFDYRRHASGLAWIILLGSLLGVLVSFGKFRDYRTVSAFFSMLVASGLAIEQIFRLTAFSRGPAGSVLGFLARPFVRKLLERG